MEIIPLHKHSGNPVYLFRRVHDLYSVLQPVAFLCIAKLFNELRIIGEIVEHIEHRDVLETFHKHALFAKGIVVQRSVYFSHSLTAGPVFSRRKKQPGHFNVLYCIEPAEAGPLFPVEFIVAGVDNAADPACYLSFRVIGQPEFAGAVLQRSGSCQGVHLVRVQCRDILGAVPV